MFVDSPRYFFGAFWYVSAPVLLFRSFSSPLRAKRFFVIRIFLGHLGASRLLRRFGWVNEAFGELTKSNVIGKAYV